MEKILPYILATFSVALFAGCSANSDNEVVKQQTSIENYLISNAPDDYYVIDDIFVQLAERKGNSRSPVLAQGDIVYLTFTGYEFQSRRVQPAFYSNYEVVINELREAGLNPIFWSYDPLEIRLGQSSELKSVQKALLRMQDYEPLREKDSVSVFLTGNLAYGENYVSNITQNAAVEFVLSIDRVIKD